MDQLYDRTPLWRRLLLIVGLPSLVAAVFIAYRPALDAGFIWDDNAHVTAPHLRSWSGLWRIWFEPGATQQYYPLLHSLFWVEQRLWGDAAFGYHLANLVLHALAACLVFAVLRRLAVPGAFLAAVIFALHPVHVESVAWITEQKNTFSAVFYLAAALVYLEFDTTRRRSRYFIGFALFCLALLTKTVTATLPAALLVLFWWKRGRLEWRRDVVPLLPWFALGAVAGLFTAWAERTLIGATGAAFELSFLQRLLLSGHVVWFYLGKLAWPENLTFIYPRWDISLANPLHWLPLVGALGLTAALWSLRHRTRAPLAAWLFFGGTLFPVLGFLNVYPFMYSFVADHFQYLASLGPLSLAAAGLWRAIRPSSLRVLAIATLAVVLGALTWPQTKMYRDAETLFRTTIQRNPAAWMAHNNLGELLMRDSATRAEAIASFRRALELRPEYHEALNNLGLALTQTGQAAEAIRYLEEAVRLKPLGYQAHNNLGIALASSGRVEASLHSFERAAALNPTLPNIRENWGRALLLLGRREAAAEKFAEAAQLRERADR